jgi:hypothetical protein
MKIPLLKQSDGKESVSFTMMLVAFGIISVWLTVSIVETAFGIPIRPFDSSQAMAYFTPLCALYFGRRWTDMRNTAVVPPSTPSRAPASEESDPAPDA